MDDEPMTSLVVVALPAEGQPVLDQGEEQKHVTLLFAAEPDDDIRKSAHGMAAQLAQLLGPFAATVAGASTLGPDEAKVLDLEASAFVVARARLRYDETLRTRVFENETYPHYRPHVTLSYEGGFEPAYEYGQEILFDRIAVWDADEQTEYPLEEVVEENENEDLPTPEPIPWHGILAVEGVETGDRRMFAEGSLTHRDLPLPLTHQSVSSAGHSNAVTVGKIEKLQKIGNEIHASGHFLLSDEADAAVGLLAEFSRYGVSIDADSAVVEELDLSDETRDHVVDHFTEGRISGACMVGIPALAEAQIKLGPHPVLDAPSEPTGEFAVSEDSWDGDASRFTIEQWRKSCLIDTGEGDEDSKERYKLPVREPNGDLSRAGVHAAAGRLGQTEAPDDQIEKAKKALRSAYDELGEEPPESITASAEMKRGPGWITHPKETSRIHSYWTTPGEPGFIKIAWGTPHDFYRCRTLVGEKIAENSPEKLRFINRICSQWHHDALGVWPGQHGEKEPEGSMAASISLVASAADLYPSEFFQDPNLSGYTPLTITDDGRVFGHVADWSSCHIGFKGTCKAPPRSASDYAYFLTGVVDTDQGQQSVGVLTIDTGHAAGNLRAAAAVSHYDNTGTAWAYVNVGEDEHGIWMSGAVRNGVDPAKVEMARATGKVSGDWRQLRRGGPYEMVAVLTVNVAGFPIPRTRVGFAGDEQVSLVAAGQVQEPEDNVAALATAVADEIERRDQRRRRASELREMFNHKREG